MKHETKNTLEVTRWCNVCRRFTQRKVEGKKPRHCLEHEKSGMSRKQEAAAKVRAQAELNPKLF